MLPGEDPAGAALALSAALFAASDVAMLAPAEDAEAVTALLPHLPRLPAPLLLGTDQAVAAELERLGAGTLVVAEGTDLAGLEDGREIVEIDPSDEEPGLPRVADQEPKSAASLLVDTALEAPTPALASAVASAVGGTVVEMPDGDLGRSSESVAAAKAAAGEDATTGVLALGAAFGETTALIDMLGKLGAMAQLPGGGTTVFPGRRMIAAYGTPDVPSLGILGEQGLEETLTRVQEMAADYDDLAEEPIVPAFELITTLASSDPGGDGDYSSELGVEGLREWVDAAGEAGVYVVLDLQPPPTSSPRPGATRSC